MTTYSRAESDPSLPGARALNEGILSLFKAKETPEKNTYFRIL
jgi:hypothetical protein